MEQVKKISIVEKAEKVIKGLIEKDRNGKEVIRLKTNQIRKFLTAVNILANKVAIYKAEHPGATELSEDLTAEMQYQDPLEPTSNTDYVAQMATFSQLEATLSMKESLTTSSDNTIKSMANQLVGKEVVVEDDEED